MGGNLPLSATSDRTPRRMIAEDAHDRLVAVRDAIRAVTELVHDGGAHTWCDGLSVSRGDLSALIGILGDRLEAALDNAFVS